VRDAYDQFRALDAEIYGVNPADAASHQAFIDAYDFPFDLLIDDGLAVSRAYDALRPEGDRIQRTVVIIDRNGRILFFQRGAPPPSELLATIAGANDGAGG
jgi:peroxiredoxin Q/BCP